MTCCFETLTLKKLRDMTGSFLSKTQLLRPSTRWTTDWHQSPNQGLETPTFSVSHQLPLYSFLQFYNRWFFWFMVNEPQTEGSSGGGRHHELWAEACVLSVLAVMMWTHSFLFFFYLFSYIYFPVVGTNYFSLCPGSSLTAPELLQAKWTPSDPELLRATGITLLRPVVLTMNKHTHTHTLACDIKHA